MAALLENQNRRNPNPNSDLDREEIEYDSNSEGDATLFSEEDPSDEAFFVAGGDGEPKFDEEEETVTGIRIGAAVTITKSIKELRDLGECLPNLDSGNLDCTRSGPRSTFDSNVVYQFEIMEYILDFDFDGHGENHCTRSGPRSAFDSNVVYQFEIMEYILDFDFDGLGENHTADFISRLLGRIRGRILSIHERMMWQTT
ncbi:hypothetical protein CDL15_Pgr028548 [Punica granatum]|uniref:Uncharacterized protein n=1 Tax=Punica granatum TaxID=22663 RepID=A0A218VXV6_PUNGR|nr:hypothetical protein CDL15_Pgr028548 [Punica granatum]